MNKLIPLITAAAFITSSASHAAEKLKALIVDGQNNHAAWPKSTIIMRDYLRESGLFEVDIARTKFTWNGKQEGAFLPLAGVGPTEDLPQAKADPDFKPDFSKYNVVISNFGYQAAPWPEETQRAFEKYMRDGGGFVSVHAADNSFPDWPEYNKMVGLGGWGGRTDKHGPYVYIDRDGKVVRDPKPGPCGTHAALNDFLITTRSQASPITKGLPEKWMHASDECYSLLRGPAENMEILATAAEGPNLRDQGRNEPMLMTIGYHKGRVFHTTLGHHAASFECVGFKVTFLRGTEWAATGKVTLTAIPENFPKADTVSKIPYSAPAK
ncbi:MAG: ThuA domain-containing protein [Luteolibacter sp.]